MEVADGRVLGAGTAHGGGAEPAQPEGPPVEPPPPGPPHRTHAELREIIESLPAASLTVLPGGAPGNIARILSDLAVESELFGGGEDGAGDSASWSGVGRPGAYRAAEARGYGLTVTWYTPYLEKPVALRVAPPPPMRRSGWDALADSAAAAGEAGAIIYLDGYALPSLGELDGVDWFDRIRESGAALLWDLAHPGIVTPHRETIREALRTVVSPSRQSGPTASGPSGCGPTLFASKAELAPLGGITDLPEILSSRPRVSGELYLVYKEPPEGATLYRVTAAGLEELSRYRGPTVTPLETTGLGDAFVAGWIKGLLNERHRPEGRPSEDGARPSDALLSLAHETARRCALKVGGAV